MSIKWRKYEIVFYNSEVRNTNGISLISNINDNYLDDWNSFTHV